MYFITAVIAVLLHNKYTTFFVQPKIFAHNFRLFVRWLVILILNL